MGVTYEIYRLDVENVPWNIGYVHCWMCIAICIIHDNAWTAGIQQSTQLRILIPGYIVSIQEFFMKKVNSNSLFVTIRSERLLKNKVQFLQK